MKIEGIEPVEILHKLIELKPLKQALIWRMSRDLLKIPSLPLLMPPMLS